MDWKIFEQKFEDKGIKIVDWLNNEYCKINSARVNPNIFNSFLVEAYGEKMPLNQVATVNMVDARTANIKPFDGSLGKSIVTTLNDGKLNANIQLDGSLVKVAFPPITEENRKTNAKKAKEYLEQAKVQIRNIRTDVQKEIKKIVGLSEDLVKSYENNLDKLTKEWNAKIEKIYTTKEAELMKV